MGQYYPPNYTCGPKVPRLNFLPFFYQPPPSGPRLNYVIETSYEKRLFDRDIFGIVILKWISEKLAV
jgi:hypothetical protein